MQPDELPADARIFYSPSARRGRGRCVTEKPWDGSLDLTEGEARLLSSAGFDRFYLALATARGDESARAMAEVGRAIRNREYARATRKRVARETLELKAENERLRARVALLESFVGVDAE